MRGRQCGQRRDASGSGKSMEVTSDQGAAVQSAHRMGDDMDRTPGVFLLDRVSEYALPALRWSRSAAPRERESRACPRGEALSPRK